MYLLIVKIRIGNCGVAGHVIAAPIFMNTGSRVEFTWRDVNVLIRRSLNDYLSTAFGRTHLDPIDIVSIHLDLAEADRFLDDQIGCDGRFPRAVRSGFSLRHFMS